MLALLYLGNKTQGRLDFMPVRLCGSVILRPPQQAWKSRLFSSFEFFHCTTSTTKGSGWKCRSRGAFQLCSGESTAKRVDIGRRRIEQEENSQSVSPLSRKMGSD